MPIHSICSEPYPAAWRWPQLQKRGIGALRSASFIEWRYYAVLAEAFHGIVGLALVNPEGRFRALAESGLLLIVAGVMDRPRLPDAAMAGKSPPLWMPPPAELCWMHRFPTGACTFDDPAPGALAAGDAECRIALTHRNPACARIEIEAAAGLRLRLSHAGLAGIALTPVTDRRLGGALDPLRSDWTVDCPSPIAATDGTLELDPGLLAALPPGPGRTPSYATPALRERIAAGARRWAWQQGSGYYEHSYGIRPLPLHGWDFLFAPDALQGQAVVLQTYRGSRKLYYLDVCWQENGAPRKHHFGADRLHREWTASAPDPVLGVRRPLLRQIRAECDGFRLELENRVLHRLPLLRQQSLAVRHFFISEEIGVVDWTLTDRHGAVLATATGQPSGGELAHFRHRVHRRSPYG